jgi:2-oxo-3-hexenedioate decarboxylase
MNLAEQHYFAKLLDKASRDPAPISQLSGSCDFSLSEAYEIQKLLVDQKLARGEVLVGVKLGFTSRAKMLQMGVGEIISGCLTDQMAVNNGGVVDFSEFIHPRIEPEIAFKLARGIEREVTRDEAFSMVEAVSPALEIIDSRYQNFKFSLEDVVADNSSSSRFVLGDWQSPDVDYSSLKMRMFVDGQEVAVGTTSEISGHPIESLVSLSRLISHFNFTLRPGSIVLAGAATAAIPLISNSTIVNEVERLGSVSVRSE